MKIDIYKDPVLYNAINGRKRDDLPFYRYWTERTPGPILELACGTGRLAKPLLEQGLDYTGLDRSPEFIHWCIDYWGDRGVFIQGNMQDFQLNRSFNLVFIGFNSFLHLYTDESAIECLTLIHRHLSGSGRFLLDIFVPSPEFLYRDESRLYQTLTFDYPEGGPCIIRERNTYNVDTEINHIHWYLDRGEGFEIMEYEFDMRMYFPDTVDRLLTEAGFVIQEKWGDYNGEPFNEESHLQLYVCSP
jgi:SAM-dependent methyltransferase